MAPDDDAVLKLAHRRAVEETAFGVFLTKLRDLLRKSWLPTPAGVGTLAAYLEWRGGESAGKLEGDEQPVVAPLVRELLVALGYEEGKGFTYNRALPGSGARAVPDYTVYAREFLASTPAFLVECKATSVTRLQGGSQDSPLVQLRRYVLSGVVHGRIGLLCNGRSLEAWDFGSDGGTRLVHLDLERLGQTAEGPDDGWPGNQEGALRTLWSRFSRQAFVQAQDLYLLSSQAPPLPDEWIEKVRARFDEGGRAGDLEADLVDYYESVWLHDAVDVAAAPELLVETLHGLIQQFADDVEHQLGEALRRRGDFEEARRELEKKSQLPRLRRGLAARRVHNFDLTQEEFEGLLLEPLDDWIRRPRLEDMAHWVSERTRTLAPHFKVANHENNEHQLVLGPAPKARKKRRNHVEAKRKQNLAALEKALKEYCHRALEEFAASRQLEGEYRSALEVAQAYQTWASRVSSSVLVGAEEAVYRREFSLQTAYVYVIRLLLVRICEDKRLFQRKLSDGGLILWQEHAGRYLDYAGGRSYEYLTQMAYECAQNVYVHFYGASELFDWYRMDDKMVLRTLLVLNAFNLESIDRDIIGAVYGRYLEEGKHEQGRYYTPRELVRTMLDLVGYHGEDIVNRRIGDLACGSGSFLVEACRRLLDQFRGRDGRIPTDRLAPALEEAQKSLFGIEINPFACYLTETNLLIQVLDLLRQAQEDDQTLTVDRFQIYSGDALVVDERLAGVSDTTLFLLGSDRANLEQLKARTGPFLEGFDFLVGNPPYVRADEDAPAYLSYRRVLEGQSWFTARHLKWDLYVPFVEQYHRLLADDPQARCCLVTIESISNAPYAAKLRELIAKKTTVHEVLFTSGLKLFEDARWQDNVIFSFSRGAPGEDHFAPRHVASERTLSGALAFEPLDRLRQLTTEPDVLFSKRQKVFLNLEDTLPWEEICYVSKGMVLHSNERLDDGKTVRVPSDYDPEAFGETLVEDLGPEGKLIRHRLFRRDDLISVHRDPLHSRPYLEPQQLLRGGIGHNRWVEYGNHTRIPARVSRPTFPELYELPKVMFGTFTGVAVDDGSTADTYFVVSHSVTVAILWHNLDKVENRSLTSARKQLILKGRYRPELSREFSEWYLCSLALCAPIQQWLHTNKRSMKEHVYPDDIKAIPVKRLSLEKQQPFIELEQERHKLWRELNALEVEGFRLGDKVEVPVHRLARRFCDENPEVECLALYQIPSSLFEITEGFYQRDLSKARAVGGEIRVGREVAMRLGDKVAVKSTVADLLARYFHALPGTFAERQRQDVLPRTEEGLLAFAGYVELQKKEVVGRQKRIEEIQAEIDQRAWELYGSQESC